MKLSHFFPVLLGTGLILQTSTTKALSQYYPAGAIVITASKQGDQPGSPTIKELELAIAGQEKRVKACRDELSRLMRKAPPMTQEQENNLTEEEKSERVTVAKEYQKAKGVFETEQNKLNKLRIDLVGAKARQAPPKEKI